MYPIRIGRNWYVGPVGGFFADNPKSDLDHLIGINSDCPRKSKIEEYSFCVVEPIDTAYNFSALLQVYPLNTPALISGYSPEGEAVLPLPFSSFLAEGDAVSLRFDIDSLCRIPADTA